MKRPTSSNKLFYKVILDEIKPLSEEIAQVKYLDYDNNEEIKESEIKIDHAALESPSVFEQSERLPSFGKTEQPRLQTAAQQLLINSLYEKLKASETRIPSVNKADGKSDKFQANMMLQGKKIQPSAPSPIEKHVRSKSDSKSQTLEAKKPEVGGLSQQILGNQLFLDTERFDSLLEAVKETSPSHINSKAKVPQLLLDSSRNTRINTQIHTERILSLQNSIIVSPVGNLRSGNQLQTEERRKCGFLAQIPSLKPKNKRLPTHFRRILRKSTTEPNSPPIMHAKRPSNVRKVSKKVTKINQQSPIAIDLITQFNNLRVMPMAMESNEAKAHNTYSKRLQQYTSKFENMPIISDPHVRAAGENRRRLFLTEEEKKIRWEQFDTARSRLKNKKVIPNPMVELLFRQESPKSKVVEAKLSQQPSKESFKRYTQDRFIPNI